MAASAYFEIVQKIYIAFYQRPADPAGLQYWAGQIDAAKGDASAVIDAFANSDETASLYGTIDADTIGDVIDSIYLALFDTLPDDAGKEFYVNGFVDGTFTAGTIALNILDGAQNDDALAIDNKVEVANLFTAQVDGRDLTDPAFGTAPFAATYEGDADAQAARDLLVAVTADAGTILTADDITTAIKDNIADAGDPIVTPEVPTFTLAAGGASVAEGSDVEFTLTASVASDTDRTFQVVITGDDKNGTVGITKADDADFVDAVQIVVLAAGETEVTFSLNPEANDGTEGFQGFKVTVLDEGFNAVAASGTVVITDVTTDTTAPVVTAQAAPATYAENSAAGTVLATVAATDDTAVIGYSLTGNDAGYFAIDAAGKITLTEAGAAAGAAANDYETGANSFTLGVVATDEAGNASAAVNYVLNVTNVDDDAPTLVGSSAAGTTVRLNFSEALKAAVIANPSAVFTVSQGSTSFSINSAAISGNVVTLTLATALAAGTTSVAYTGTVLEDAVGNKVAAIPATAVTSTDIVPPALSSSNPADDSTTFGAASNLVLTFSEAVVAGSGQIKIVNTADATDTRTIDIKDAAQVTISGSTVTINPTADLKAGGTYAVNIDATAVLDAAGNAYAGIANNTTLNFTAAAATPPVVPGQTFTLTKDIQVLNGTSGNDTFVATNDAAANSPTLNTGDQINGDAGSDTLEIISISNDTPIVTLKNIEKVQFQQLTANSGNISAANWTGVTEIANVNSTKNLTVTDLGGKVKLTLSGDTAANTTELIFKSGVLGVDAAFDLDVTGAGTKAATRYVAKVDTTAASTDSIKTLNVAATGKNFVDFVVENNNVALAGKVTALNVSGTGTLDLIGTGNILQKLATVNASQNSGGLTVDLSGVTAATLAVTGGSGKDVITANAATIETIDLGAGDDTLTVATGGNVTTADTYKGGDGKDTLMITAATNANTLVAGKLNAQFSGFEVLGLTTVDANIDVSKWGVNELTIAGDVTDSGAGTAFTASGFTTGATVTLTANADQTDILNVGIKNATDAGTPNDTLNIKLAADLTAAHAYKVGVDGINILNVDATDPDAVTSTGVYTLTLSSASNVREINVTGKSALTLDASGFGGTEGVKLASTASGDLTFVGTGLSDVITGGSGKNVITGGAGKDTIDISASAAKQDTIALSGITAAANADTIKGFVAGAAATTGDLVVLDKGDTKDTTGAGAADFLNATAAATVVNANQAVTQFNVTASKDVIELGNAALGSNGDLSAATDGTELLKALASSGTATGITAETAAGADTVYFVAYQGGNAYLYYGNDAGGGTAGLIEASEITLVGTFQGVAAGAFAAGDFILV